MGDGVVVGWAMDELVDVCVAAEATRIRGVGEWG